MRRPHCQFAKQFVITRMSKGVDGISKHIIYRYMYVYSKYYDAHVLRTLPRNRKRHSRGITGDNTQYVIRILTCLSVCMRPAHLDCLAAI